VSAVTNSFSLVSFHRFFPVLLLAGLVSACTGLPRAPETGAVVSWSQLPGWRNDRPAEAWPALLQTCQKLPVRDARWRELCAEAALFPDPDDDIARAFFETRFEPRVLRHGDGADGLITGYYEPLLNGSLTKTERFRYPIYQPPKDLLTVDIGEVYPELRGKTLRGRVAGKRVVPYFSRAEITHGGQVLTGNELVRVRLPDGTLLFVGYADQNGHPYQAIGRRLVELGALQVEEVNLESIRAWLKAHPQEAEGVLNSNPSYVFFLRRESNLPGPLGSLNVPLTRERSIAVDPAYIPLGTPVWLDTTLGNGSEQPYRRLMFAQDTGGAIKGAVRADVFFGFGEDAERRAGAMKSRGRLYVLWPQRYRVAGD
jgi:membrane-bound lytic murein transglycosylase A